MESKSRIRRRIITIVQNRQYSKTLSFSAVSLFLVIGFTFFTTAKETSTEKTPYANEQQEIIDIQPRETDNAFQVAMTGYDSGASMSERVMQETEEESREEILFSSSNKTTINDILTRPKDLTPKIEGQQKLAEDKRKTEIAEDELTEMVKGEKPLAAQPSPNRQEAEEQIQTVVTTHDQRVSAEALFESNEQNMFLKDAAISGDQLDPIKKDDPISEQKSDMVREAKAEDKGAKKTEDAESLLDEPRVLTSTEKSDPSIAITNAYPTAVLFRDHIDERITTTSLLHYLEGNGHSTLYSQEAERITEDTRISSAVKEDPIQLGIEKKQSGKETSDSFKFDEPPKILSKGSVNYPFRAKRLGLSGKVSVSFLVDTNGHATNIEAVKAEPANVLMIFAGAAEKGIAKFRFKPGTSEGEPVPVKVEASVIFKI